MRWDEAVRTASNLPNEEEGGGVAFVTAVGPNLDDYFVGLARTADGKLDWRTYQSRQEAEHDWPLP